MAHLYMQHRVGDLVDVARGRNSEGGRAYVVAKRSSSPSSVVDVDVEYILTRKISKNVDPERIAPARIDTVARRRPRSASVDVPIQPSLLSIHHQAAQQLMSITPSPPKRRKTPTNLVTTDVLIEKSRIWAAAAAAGRPNHPILVYLQRNNNKDAGYLRRNDAKAAGVVDKLKSHCSPEEKNRILRVKDQLTGVVDFNQHGVTQLIAHAYGIGKRTLQDWQKKGMDQSRKQRSDAGSNILTSSKLQDNWFSAYKYFKKAQRRQQSTIANTLLDTAADSDRNLKEQWDAMSPEQQKPYVLMSKEQKDRLPFLIGEIQTALQSTGGYCTWRQLETHLSQDGVPVISYQHIRRLVMGLPESQYTSTKLLPALTAAHIIKRKIWCQQFWIFWDSARKLIRKRILLVHMDEKWFYGIVVRMNNKLVPFLGMEKTDSCRSVHHKNYVNKFMVLVDSYCLPDDNNIEAGGQGFHGLVIRAGHMEVATTTTYRRQTDPDTGKISYPKIAGNESRIAGQSYFAPAEVTANTRMVRGKRKFSLQHDYWPKLINKLEALCRRLRYETGGDDIVPLYQWDGAGPHAKKELIEWRSKKFIDRGWICRNQASQSPHLQVHDTSIFPMLSKIVSNIQSMGSAGVVDNDRLWEIVQDAYYNKLTPETIARAFAHHVQIVNAIYNCNGGDSYHRTGGLHCGVRKAYAPKYRLNDAGEPIGEPIGVQLIESPDEETKPLRYNRPTPEELDAAVDDKGYGELFNRSQLEFLVANLPEDTAEHLLAEEAIVALDRE